MSTFTKTSTISFGNYRVRLYKDDIDSLWLNTTDIMLMGHCDSNIWHQSTPVFDIPEDSNVYGVLGVIPARNVIDCLLKIQNEVAFSIVAVLKREQQKLRTQLSPCSPSRTIDSISSDEIQKFIDENIDTTIISNDSALKILNRFITITKNT